MDMLHPMRRHQQAPPTSKHIPSQTGAKFRVLDKCIHDVMAGGDGLHVEQWLLEPHLGKRVCLTVTHGQRRGQHALHPDQCNNQP